MDAKDHVINGLMDALDKIAREAQKESASRHFILGLSEQARENCNRLRVRNKDGYLVVQTFSVTVVDAKAPHAFIEDTRDAARVRHGAEDIAHCLICGQAQDRQVHQVSQ